MNSRHPLRFAFLLLLAAGLTIRQLPAQEPAPTPIPITGTGPADGTDPTDSGDETDPGDGTSTDPSDADPTDASGTSTDPTDPGLITTTVEPIFVRRPDFVASAVVNQPFTYQIRGDSPGRTPVSFGLQETKDIGMSVDPHTGLLTGTPTKPGVYLLTLPIDYKNIVSAPTLSLRVYADPISTVAISRVIDTPRTEAGERSGVFIITRTGGDLTKPLVVHYGVKGSAIKGWDYKILSGRVRFKKGETSRRIRVHPRHRTDVVAEMGIVKLTLHTGRGYLVGDQATAKLKTPILY